MKNKYRTKSEVLTRVSGILYIVVVFILNFMDMQLLINILRV